MGGKTKSKASKVKNPGQKTIQAKSKKSKQSRSVQKTDEPVKVYNYFTTPDQTKDPEPKMKNFKTLAIYGLLICTILTLLIALILILVLRDSDEKSKSRNVCETPECITLAHQLHNFQDDSVNPCDDFYKYSCGKYYEHVTVEGPTITKKNLIVLGILQEFLLKNQTATSKSENAMKTLFWKCKEYHNHTNHKATSDLHLEQVRQDIAVIGPWPLNDPNWQESSFDLNHYLERIPSMTSSTVIDFGIFSVLMPAAAPKLWITKTEDKLWPAEKIKQWIKYFIRGRDSEVDQEVQNIVNFDGMLKAKIVQFELNESNYLASYSDLKSQFRTIDFDRVIRKMMNTNSKNWENVKSRISVKREFLNEAARIEDLISKNKKTAINYLIFKYIQSSYNDLGFKNGVTLSCPATVQKKLPRASIRVFVQNHFDKKNLEEVSDLIEDIRVSFIEMLEDSKWLHEKTREGAIRKVKGMKKTVGYPEDFEETGKLDSIYQLDLKPTNSFHQMLRKIQRFSMEQMMYFVSMEVSISPAVTDLEPNAMYSKFDNSLTVFVPLMDEPLYHSSYPEYAKIAGVGNIIGHEMGHGFGGGAITLDENGNPKNWMTDADSKEYENRMMCLVKQYEQYDDPSFGKKKLNGTLTLNEMVPDEIGRDVAWRTFKKLDIANEQKIIGFEEYSIEKLYFQIVALNWCAPRITIPLERQLKDFHATHSFRVNGVFSNMNEFAETYECPVGSPMNPKKKCTFF